MSGTPDRADHAEWHYRILLLAQAAAPCTGASASQVPPEYQKNGVEKSPATELYSELPPAEDFLVP